MLTNYLNSSATSSANFYDAASTALLASTVYRAASLLQQNAYISYAERSRQALSAPAPAPSSSLNSTSSESVLFPAYAHFTTNGVLHPVVNPYAYGAQATSVSPEAQAFVVQMHVAWKHWKASSGGGGGMESLGFASGAKGGAGKLIWLVFTLIWMAL